MQIADLEREIAELRRRLYRDGDPITIDDDEDEEEDEDNENDDDNVEESNDENDSFHMNASRSAPSEQSYSEAFEPPNKRRSMNSSFEA